jgi:hypothetical protein
MRSHWIVNVCLLSILLPLGSAYAGQKNSTYDFLRLDNGARSAALAGSFVSVTDDPIVIFYNPAGLGTLNSKQASFGFLKHLLDINSGYVAYGQQFRDWGWFGAGVSYINYGSFTEMDDVGNRLGTFHASEIALLASYSNLLEENIHYGVSLKLIYSSIADSRSAAAAVDIGGLYIVEAEQITIGASLLNIGRQINSYIETREDLPLDLKVGFSKRLEHLPLLLSFDFHRLNESAENFAARFRAFSVGGEFTLSEELRLRIGYNNNQRRELKIGTSAGLAGFSIGGGFQMDRYKVDYAFSSLGKIGALHRVTLGVNF